jgi:omega-amidase
MMKVAMIQVATILDQPHKNRVCLEAYLQDVMKQRVDTVVFPEMWDVGFFPENIKQTAETHDENKCLVWMQDWAKAHRVNIVGGSIAVKEGENLYNRCYVINREGEIVTHYDKIHLFSPGKEPQSFTPGQKNELFELDGTSCAVQICYDIRFPEFARKQALAGAKILFVPAQWPHPRSNHWVTLNKARAIENQLFVVATNGCGIAGKLKSCGHSAVYDPWGEELVHASESEQVCVTMLDVDTVDEVRAKIPVFEDRRPLLY